MRRRITKIKKTNRIKKEHLYILGLILLLSIFGFLIYKVLIYKTKNNNPDTLIEANETIVDYKVPNTTMCDGNTLDSIKQESYKINVEYGEAEQEIETNFADTDEFNNIITSRGTYKINVFVANIVNISDKFNVYVMNDTFGDKDIGTKINDSTIQVIPDIDETIEKFLVYVYAKDDCSGALVRKFSFLTPIYNSNADTIYCNDHQNEIECNRYVYDENVDFTSDKFQNKIIDYAEEALLKEEKSNSINYKYIIISGCIFVILIVGVIVIIKKRR